MNHFIPGKLRPNWKIFIDTLALKIDRLLEVRQVNKGIAADMEEIKSGKTKTISHEKLKKKLKSGANR